MAAADSGSERLAVPMNAIGCVLLLGILTAGTEKGEIAFRPGPLEARVPERFRLAAAVFSYELTPVLSTRNYAVSTLRFPSPVETADPENNVVHAEYLRRAAGRKGPGVIVLHILGADFPLSRYMAARLADRGVAALFVKLPYYGERRPPDRPLSTRRFLSSDVERTVTAMRQGVCDVRRAAGWLAARPEIDAGRLGVTGVSLGGIVSAVAAAVDPTINHGAFLLAGGDVSSILWGMPEGAAFRAAWVESGRTPAELKALTEPFDP